MGKKQDKQLERIETIAAGEIVWPLEPKRYLIKSPICIFSYMWTGGVPLIGQESCSMQQPKGVTPKPLNQLTFINYL